MKIIKLQANNIKKLTAVSITPEGNVVTLAGDNGAGKSWVEDARSTDPAAVVIKDGQVRQA